MRDGDRHAQGGEGPGNSFFVAWIDKREEQRHCDRFTVRAPQLLQQPFNFTISEGFQDLARGGDSLSDAESQIRSGTSAGGFTASRL